MRSLEGASGLLDEEVDFLESVKREQTAGFGQELWNVPRPVPIINQEKVVQAQNDFEPIALAQKCSHEEMPRTVLGPRMAIKRLGSALECETHKRTVWFEQARCEAILGGARGSLPSFASGVRCYLHFAEHVLKKKGPKLPPSADELLAYSHMFRCIGTFSNYLGYLRKGCLLEGVPVDVFEHPAVRAAKKSVKKRGRFEPRMKLFVKWPIVSTDINFDPKYGMLFAITYCFLLRLPSEVDLG